MFRSPQVLRQHARRAFSTEAKEVASSSAPAATATTSSSRGGSSFGQRLLSFTIGFGLASGYALFQLREDVDQSTHEIQGAVAALKGEVLAQNAALTKRIEQLEKRQ